MLQAVVPVVNNKMVEADGSRSTIIVGDRYAEQAPLRVSSESAGPVLDLAGDDRIRVFVFHPLSNHLHLVALLGAFVHPYAKASTSAQWPSAKRVSGAGCR